VQFIVTTHSPLVLSNIYSKHIREIEGGKIYGAEDTFGQSINDILEDRMHTESSEFGDEIKNLFELIDANDMNKAKALKLNLESLIEGTRPELVKANAFIKRKELVGK
jgi:predicted ATP-binding protein involved in virulence